jgi:hypothetical protein
MPENSATGARSTASAKAALSASGRMKPSRAQIIGRTYRWAPGSNLRIASRQSRSTKAASTGGFISRLLAERSSRSQCRSRSGAQPSKARAPSNTTVDIQKAWSSPPISGGLASSCQRPSCQTTVSMRAILTGEAAAVSRA